MSVRRTYIANLALVCGLVLALTALVPKAKADSVQVGTLDLYSSPYVGDTYEGSVLLTDNMSDTSLLASDIILSGTSFANSFSVAPGDTELYYNWGAGDLATIGASGTIGSDEFTAGGITYEATDPDWTLELPVTLTETVAIDIDATPLNSGSTTVPEPGTYLLLLLGIVFVIALAPRMRAKATLAVLGALGSSRPPLMSRC